MTARIARPLNYRDGREICSVRQDGILAITAPTVVLGETGMGKTHLLEWLAFPRG